MGLGDCAEGFGGGVEMSSWICLFSIGYFTLSSPLAHTSVAGSESDRTTRGPGL